MQIHIVLIVTAVKLFFIPLYHSTDFEVHRNWLAVTHNLTIDKWYYDVTSEWTLDYPPFFAWLEYGLSHVAKFFDPEMLYLDNLNYKSDMTVIFQRLSVIILDLLYIYSVKSCVDLIAYEKHLMFIILVANPGLLMVDHIHFQYNGFLYGFFLYSISNIIRGNYIEGAIWFAILLNMKHIFLYVAPVYIVYLLRTYCFTVSSNDGIHTAWYSFSIMNLLKLGVTVIAIFVLSFGPFIEHLPQLLSRLFPFKRGLSHAYWAPNFWAIYNFADKVGQVVLPRLGVPVAKVEASMTGGLVQEFSHAVLPSVSPRVTFLLTAASMVPALVKLWYLGADRRYRNISFVRCIVVCTTCSFMFGWHVHEKAILMVLIPLSFLAFLGDVDGKLFLFLSTVGHYSLFPLLYPKNLLAIKIFLLLTHVALIFGGISSMYEDPKVKSKSKRVTQLEVNRLFKSEIFNAVEHTLRTNYYNKMSKEERNVLLGDCLKYEKKLTIKSPLVNEVFCHRDMDYRIFGLGIMKYPHLDVRLKFLQRAISGPEEELENWGISLGILGMPRSGFDTMLRPLPMAAQQASTTSGDSRFSSMRMSSASSRSCSSVKKSQKSVIERKLYPDVRIPPRGRESAFPPSFPDATEPHRACSEVQRRRWQQRLHRLLHPPPVSRRKSVLEFSTLTHL